MCLTSKLCSLAVAMTYAAAEVLFIGWTPDIWLISAALPVPLALIWFPQEISVLVGSGRIREQRMAVTVFPMFGWLALVSMPVLFVTMVQS